jgi:hypothetical protein
VQSERADVSEDIAYFVGPPRFFKPTAVTAPRTLEVTFILPAWFGDRNSLTRLPQTGCGRRSSSWIGSVSDIAGSGGAGSASPTSLSGNRAIWLDDDGERIRALDPTQPPGERVGYSEVSAVAPGLSP